VLDLQRAKTRGRRRRWNLFLFLCCGSWSLIILRSSSHINGRAHHEHLRSRGIRSGLVYHLSLLRRKRIFEDNRGPFEQKTDFGSSWTILSMVILSQMRQGYLGFHCDDSLADNLGGHCFGPSALALPLPFFFPFNDLSTTVDWTGWTSEVLPGPGGF